jgi:methanogenic corrinoid protein MtbC1
MEADKAVPLSDKELRAQQLTNALFAGRVDEARHSTYAAIGRGNTKAEVLDALVEAVSIVADLHEVGEYDQARVAATESAVNSCLQVLEDWLAKSQARFGLKVIIGPVGLRAGSLMSLALSAAMRSAGFPSTSLGKTKTPLEILRNSEELGADIVVALLPSDGVQGHVTSFAQEVERGGFRDKFEVILLAPGLPEEFRSPLAIARNSGEAITKATEIALKRQPRDDDDDESEDE